MSATIFDYDTGVILNSDLEEQAAKARAEEEQEAADFAAMAGTPGWLRLSDWVRTSVANLKEALVDATEPALITRLQQQIIAASQILAVVETKVFEHQQHVAEKAGEQSNGRS